MLKIPFTKESRIDLIDLAIKKTKSKKYLEIGCDKNKVFNNVACEHKVGVDPVRGGTHRMYSDEFFKFKLVLIDNGCGIVFKTPTTKNKIEVGSTWEFYFNNWNKLPLVSFEQIKKELV